MPRHTLRLSHERVFPNSAVRGHACTSGDFKILVEVCSCLCHIRILRLHTRTSPPVVSGSCVFASSTTATSTVHRPHPSVLLVATRHRLRIAVWERWIGWYPGTYWARISGGMRWGFPFWFPMMLSRSSGFALGEARESGEAFSSRRIGALMADRAPDGLFVPTRSRPRPPTRQSARSQNPTSPSRSTPDHPTTGPPDPLKLRP